MCEDRVQQLIILLGGPVAKADAGIEDLAPVTGTLVRIPRANGFGNGNPLVSVLCDSFDQPFILLRRPRAFGSSVNETVPPAAAAIFVGPIGHGLGQFAPEKWAILR